MANVVVVITKDVDGTPLKKGQEVALDSQTATLLVNVEKVAKYKEVEFLVRVGEYKHGSDPLADEAIRKMPAIQQFLKQTAHDHTPFDAMVSHLIQLSV